MNRGRNNNVLLPSLSKKYHYINNNCTQPINKAINKASYTHKSKK